MSATGSPRFSLSVHTREETSGAPAPGLGTAGGDGRGGQSARGRSGRVRRAAGKRGDRPVGSGPAPPPSSMRRAVEWVVIVAVALVVAFAVKTFVLQAFFIPSGSMEPTLMVGDRILVDKLSYDLHAVHRGDIVVFSNPMKGDTSIKDLVKRVVGLPGETISSDSLGHVLINGRVLPQPYLPRGTAPASRSNPITTQTIRPGYIFVMGDNRSESEDSRSFGQVPESSIVGRVIVRVWPLGSIHFF